MGVQICPECGAVCQASDTHCMDCGCDIAAAEREIARRAKEERGGGPMVGDKHTVEGAAAGMADPGETSEKVRLKQFDKHLAEKLEAEGPAAIVTAVIAFVFGAGILFAGWQALQGAGGLAAIGQMSYTDLRERGLGAFADQTFVATLLILLGLAGLLCMVGQVRRYLQGRKAVAQVKRGERPDLVGISQLTWIGLLIASFVFPPLGIVLGIIFMLGKDDDTKRLGSQMLKSALIAVGVIVLHLIWNAITGFASQSPAAPRVDTVE